MKTYRRSFLLVAASAAILGAQSETDDLLYDRVHRKLNNHPALRIRDLKVDVTDGVVTIEGTVRSISIKNRASKIATMKGVKKVINNLVVGV